MNSLTTFNRVSKFWIVSKASASGWKIWVSPKSRCALLRVRNSSVTFISRRDHAVKHLAAAISTSSFVTSGLSMSRSPDDKKFNETLQNLLKTPPKPHEAKAEKNPPKKKKVKIKSVKDGRASK